MQQKTLAGASRQELKKGPSRRLRKSGKIPAVVYGHRGSFPITVDAHEFHNKFKRISENAIIKLSVDKDSYEVLVKDYQENILKGTVTHIDFYEIVQGKVLRTNVPVRLNGTAIGVREGGILEHLLYDVEVECLPSDIPEILDFDITDLSIGDSIHIRDIQAVEGVRFLNPEEQVIAQVAAIKIEEEVVEEEEGEGEEGEEGEEGDEEAASEDESEEE